MGSGFCGGRRLQQELSRDLCYAYHRPSAKHTPSISPPPHPPHSPPNHPILPYAFSILFFSKSVAESRRPCRRPSHPRTQRLPRMETLMGEKAKEQRQGSRPPAGVRTEASGHRWNEEGGPPIAEPLGAVEAPGKTAATALLLPGARVARVPGNFH